MGCPVKKVVKTGSGAALMRDPQRVAAILQAMRKATDLPLTVKIRAGWRHREINALEIGRIAEECGVDAVILHPRTADQGFGGESDWGLIAALKAQLRIPVIGSGDVRCPEDAARMFRETGCDGVMVGRGALGNPWLIGNILPSLSGGDVSAPSLAEREEIIRRHLELAIDYYGEKVGNQGLPETSPLVYEGSSRRRPVPPGGGTDHRSGFGLEGPAGLFSGPGRDSRRRLKIRS